MINREYVPAVVIHLAQRVQLLLWLAEITDVRLVVHIFQRINLERATFFAADDAARFQRRIPPRRCDQLLQLFVCQSHFRFPIFDLRFAIYKSAIGNRKSQIPTRRAQFCHPQSCNPRASIESRAVGW